MVYTSPKANVAIGMIASLVKGSIMPVFGILLGKILFKLEGYSTVYKGVSC